jgi:hypothetical protein
VPEALDRLEAGIAEHAHQRRLVHDDHLTPKASLLVEDVLGAEAAAALVVVVDERADVLESGVVREHLLRDDERAALYKPVMDPSQQGHSVTQRYELQREQADDEGRIFELERPSVADLESDVVRAPLLPVLAELRFNVDPDIARGRARGLIRGTDGRQHIPGRAADVDDGGFVLDVVSRARDAPVMEDRQAVDRISDVPIEVAGVLGE